MVQSCGICVNINRAEIDREIIKGRALAVIARDFGLDYDSLYRHSQNHVVKNAIKVLEKQDLNKIENLDLLSEIDHILKKAREIFDRNLQDGHDTTALKALSEIRSVLDLLAKISYSFNTV